MATSRYAFTTLLFRICFGAVYASVFLSLLPQVGPLIGSRGLLPIAGFVEKNPSLNYLNFPTVHLFFSSDFFLYLFLVLGVACSLLLIFGCWPRWALLGCFLLYLSYATSGRDFFYFQWDNLLLEATFPALFLPLGKGLMKMKKRGEPSLWIVFLFRWLLFRLYFESGIAKLLYGKDDWLAFTAMSYYYETAPLPSFGGWLAQQLLPQWMHSFSVLLTFGMELLIPLLLFYPRTARIFSFYALAAFNIIIGFTSNYGFFNALAIVIGLFLLDDRHLHQFRILARVGKGMVIAHPQKKLRALAIALAVFIIPFSIIEFLPVAGVRYDVPATTEKIQNAYHPFRIISRYHLFPGVVKERVVIEIRGSEDGREWKQIILKHTPQHETQMAPWLPLYQSRFAFSYSFLTLGRMDEEYFGRLLEKLCSSPGDLAPLVEANPFPYGPQRLRLDFYRYAFSTPGELAEEGKWWRKEYLASSESIPCR